MEIKVSECRTFEPITVTITIESMEELMHVTAMCNNTPEGLRRNGGGFLADSCWQKPVKISELFAILHAKLVNRRGK